QVLDLRGLLALVVLEQVDRLLADDAADHPVAGGDLHALADEDLRVPPADPDEAQEPVVVDVRDDQADLVDVADDCQPRPVGGALDARPHRPHDVGGDLGELGCRISERGGRRGLVSRRAGRGEQRAQNGGNRHSRTLTVAYSTSTVSSWNGENGTTIASSSISSGGAPGSGSSSSVPSRAR